MLRTPTWGSFPRLVPIQTVRRSATRSTTVAAAAAAAAAVAPGGAQQRLWTAEDAGGGSATAALALAAACAPTPTTISRRASTSAAPNPYAAQAADQQERAAWVRKLQDVADNDGRRLQSALLGEGVYDVAFARSSGPGGQNVNKVSTKARVELRLGAAAVSRSSRSGDSEQPLPPMPRRAMQHLVQNSKYYVASSHALLVYDDTHRTQSANLASAYAKLHRHMLDVLGQDLVGETSSETRERVQSLVRRERARKRQNKDRRGSVKQGRKVSRSAVFD